MSEIIIEKYQTKQDLENKRYGIFYRLFAKIIFKNKIVATVLYNVAKQIVAFENKLDETLSHDV